MSEALSIEVWRPEEIEDWSEIDALRRTALDGRLGWDWPAPTALDMKEGARLVLGYRGDELVGSVRVTPEVPGEEAGPWDVGRMVAKYQRRGIGREVYQAAENVARLLGATCMLLAATPLPGTVEFYESQGYTRTGRSENYPGAYGDVICIEMTKDLQQPGPVEAA